MRVGHSVLACGMPYLQATEVVEDTGDKAAAYHLARRLESEVPDVMVVRSTNLGMCQIKMASPTC